MPAFFLVLYFNEEKPGTAEEHITGPLGVKYQLTYEEATE